MLGNLFNLYREKREMVKAVTGWVTLYIIIAAYLTVFSMMGPSANKEVTESLNLKLYLWMNGVVFSIYSLVALINLTNKPRAISWMVVATTIAATNFVVFGAIIAYIRTKY